MTALGIAWPDVSLERSTNREVLAVRVVVGLATAVSCVDVVLTSTVKTALVALLSSALPRKSFDNSRCD